MQLKSKEFALVNTPGRVIDMAFEIFDENFEDCDKERESVVALYMNVKNEVLRVELHSQGTVDASMIYLREINKVGLLCNAASLIMIHNHPSGHVEPSEYDFNFARQIQEMEKYSGIQLLDSIILGRDKKYFSFKEENLL